MSQSSSFDAASAQNTSSDSLFPIDSSTLETAQNKDSSTSSDGTTVDPSNLSSFFETAPSNQPIARFESGQFTVDTTGTVRIALSASTLKVGEVALFSLVGMEALEPGSPAFVQTAIERSLSKSAMGCILSITGDDLESQPNFYKYQITLEPGTQFALMWNRSGAIATLPSLAAAESTDLVFSIPAANAQTIAQFGQFTTSNGDVLFGFISPQANAISTSALDIVSLRIVGATGQAAPLDFNRYAAEAWDLTDSERTTRIFPRIAAVPIPIAVPVDPLRSSRVALSDVVNMDELMPAAAIVELELDADEELNAAATLTMPTANFATAMSLMAPVAPRTNIIWRNYTTGVNELWEIENERVRRQLSLTFVPPSDWRLVGCADMTNDGYADLVWHNSSSGEITVWQMQGAALNAAYNILPRVAAPWQLVGIGDFNRDGRPELMWRNAVSGENVYWVLDAAGRNVVSDVYLTRVDSSWQLQAVGDFTGDGYADLLWRNPTTGQNVYSTVNGTQIEGIWLTSVPGSEWRIQGCADFTGDGKADVLWRNVNTGENVLWMMNGTTIVRTSYLASQPAWQDWRATLPFAWNAPEPSVQLQLANDTSPNGTNTDRVTADPTITGRITSAQRIKQLLIQQFMVDGILDITSSVRADNTFTITPAHIQ